MKVCGWRICGWRAGDVQEWGSRGQRGPLPPSKGTTLMYDYTIILLEPLHRSSLAVSSPQSQNSFYSQIFHFSPSVLFAFSAPFLFARYHCEPSGRGRSLSGLLQPTVINCICVCRSIKCKFLLPVSSPLLWFVSSTTSFLYFLHSSVGQAHLISSSSFLALNPLATE